jgi:hypothetical protein
MFRLIKFFIPASIMGCKNLWLTYFHHARETLTRFWFQGELTVLVSTSIGFDTPACSPTASRKDMKSG